MDFWADWITIFLVLVTIFLFSPLLSLYTVLSSPHPYSILSSPPFSVLYYSTYQNKK